MISIWVNLLVSLCLCTGACNPVPKFTLFATMVLNHFSHVQGYPKMTAEFEKLSEHTKIGAWAHKP